MKSTEIEARISLVIPIPENMILIEKTRLRELEENEFSGRVFTMKDFVERAKRSSTWLKDNILNNPKLIKTLDVENGGWVYYPYSQSDRWLFKPSGMIHFIDNELWKYLGGKS